MPLRSRRTFLRVTGAGIVCLSGCLGVDDSSSQSPRFVSLTVHNYHTESHTLHVALRRDGEEQYRRDFDLDAGEPTEPSGFEAEEYPPEPGPATMFAWRDDQSMEDAATFAFSDYETECIGLLVTIGEYDTDWSDVVIWHTANCNG